MCHTDVYTCPRRHTRPSIFSIYKEICTLCRPTVYDIYQGSKKIVKLSHASSPQR